MSTAPASLLPHVALTVDGSPVGDVRAIDGLQMAADIAANDLGPDNVAKKHVANIRWTPGVVSLGLGMGKAMAAWLQRSFAGGGAPSSGSITLADAKDRAQSTLTFTNAVLTRCTFPALDAASKAPAALAVEFAPEQARLAKGDGSDIRTRMPPVKPWLASGFKIEIGSLPCAHVLRVEAMSWTAEVAADQVGIFREPTKHPAKITVPDLTLTIAIADFPAWSAAAKAWFVDGAHLEANEMQGTLTLLAGDTSLLAAIGLRNLGFKGFQTLAPASAQPDRFTVSLYVEAMTFDLKA